MSFQLLNLSPSLIEGLQEQNFLGAYPIQQEVIPAVLSNHDIIAIAPTGSGKTLSYVLPLLMQLEHNVNYKNRHVRSLILVPTRELCVQVHQCIQSFVVHIERRLKSMAVYGGVSINPQMKGLQHVEILVATPGRLLDLLEKNALYLDQVKLLVMDEADKLLNMGFTTQVEQIIDLLPTKRQNLLFSATLTPKLDGLTKLALRDPKVIKVGSDEINIDLIKQEAYAVPDEKKGPFLRYLIKANSDKRILVFTSSIHKADRVVHKLGKNGIKAKAIHSKISQGGRGNALQAFKTNKIKVLVATDLIARGIDIDKLPIVINYELPRSPKDYIHRIGRTGRAESEGIALALVSPAEEHHFKVIQKKIGTWTPLESIEQINLL